MHETHINQWIESIKKSHKELNNFSICPYTSRARHIEIEKIVDSKNINVSSLGKVDIKIFVLDDDISQDELEKICVCLNEKYYNLIFLPDHKDSNFNISNIKTGNQKFNLILCQSREKLNHYRNLLKKTSYYDNWTEENLENIFKF